MELDALDPRAIRNLVFDLGGVLYAIDPPRTAAALRALAGPGARHMHAEDPLFLQLEMGSIEPARFRAELRKAIDSTASDAELDLAWNALLLGPIPGRREAIAELARHYPITLLSNTNVIHQEVWGPECAEMFGHMERTFFSFDMGLRKPGTEIYAQLLLEMGYDAAETLFLDDSPANVAAARAVGIQAMCIDPTDQAQFPQFCLKFIPKS